MSGQLTEKEFMYVKDTWGNVEKRMKLDGNRIFIRLFQKHPEYKAWFPDFNTMDDEELKTNPRLKAHVLRVTTSLGMLLYASGDPQALKVSARAIVNTHHFRGVRRPQFDDFMTIFKEYIHYVVRTGEARAAWGKALDLISHNISYDDSHAQLY